MEIFLRLGLVFFKISLCAIGGAYSFLPFLERELVHRYNWLTKEEFMDVLGIVKIFPGAISVKFATYTGYKIAGITGAVAANIGNVAGPVLLSIFAFTLYFKYKDLPYVKAAFNAVQISILAMLLALVIQLGNLKEMARLKNIVIFVVSFALFLSAKVHPAFIIIGAGIAGILVNLF
jgi:chromate transporter